MTPLLFVYGTLMRGYDHPMARMLAARASWRGAARCRGRLYRIAHYPGLVMSDETSDLVHGDVFTLPDDNGALLAALDDYEGCGTNDPPPHPYAREVIEVTLADGTHMPAWTYVYRLPVDETRRIAGGRFN